ncbi:MAG TPA: thiamine phosphate synthase [Geminicoccaceae bacterium]|nr:thiamine phosphate synthase [Geminicoccus sp.]HMU52048.1 thiamine phosphate synthase [Geminicoccaceae bacterium]
MSAPVDLRVYAVLDPTRCLGRPLGAMAAAAAAGGATLLQLRIKHASTRELVAAARETRSALAGTGVPLIVNDRVDVALAVDADGVHVGQEDMAAADVRRLIGAEKLLGITVHTVEQAREGLGSADHAGLGPVFGSASKDNTDPELGIAGLKRLIGETGGAFPTCAISGIDHTNAAEVISAGADGVAVISDIFMAEDVEAATRRLRRVVDAALAGRAGR